MGQQRWADALLLVAATTHDGDAQQHRRGLGRARRGGGREHGAEWDPSLSEDGRVIVFTSNRLSPLRDIFVATRPSTTVAFGGPEAVTILNSPDSDFDPHVTTDGCAIYFASDRGRSAGDLTIYVSRVTL